LGEYDAEDGEAFDDNAEYEAEEGENALPAAELGE
jgi:hypothetical protein